MKLFRDLLEYKNAEDKKNALATKITIFIAVIILGSIIFDISFVREEDRTYIEEYFGTYGLNISDISNGDIKNLKSSELIKNLAWQKVSSYRDFDFIEDDVSAKYIKNYSLSIGKIPKTQDEIVISDTFSIKYKAFTGDKIKIDGKEKIISGIYTNYSKSYEKEIVYGRCDFSREDDANGVFITFKNERDTYRDGHEILKSLGIDEKSAIKEGRVSYNSEYLRTKFIYENGLPSKKEMGEKISQNAPFVMIMLVSAFMIYGAFNVYNSRDIREISLLKSAGMTSHQIKKLIHLKILKLSTLPILLGTVVSYFVANLILYGIWYNNQKTYKNLGGILEKSMAFEDFKICLPRIFIIFLVLLISFVTVYISAIVPARNTAKLEIIDGLNGNFDKKIKKGKSKINGDVEKTLAKEYYRAYRKVYRVMLIIFSLSIAATSLVTVSQSYRKINILYSNRNDPYNIEVSFSSLNSSYDELFQEILNENQDAKIFLSSDFNLKLKDNISSFGKDFKNEIENGNKKNGMNLRLIGILDKDFFKFGLNDGYYLVNRVPVKNVPYKLREYMKVTDKNEFSLNFRDYEKEKNYKVEIIGNLNEIPYDIEGISNDEIVVITNMTRLSNLIESISKDKEFEYQIKLKSEDENKDLKKIQDIVNRYVPKSDRIITTNSLEKYNLEEQNRNERFLNLMFQGAILMIAISNGYSSFNGNLNSRKREFGLLQTAGMTQKSIRKLLYGEIYILFKKFFIVNTLVFILAVVVRILRSNFNFIFGVKEIILNTNYTYLILVVIFLYLGIFLSVRKGIKKILNSSIVELLNM